jgi:hypothetical protein
LGSITRKQIIGLGLALAFALLVVDLLVGPPAHDVHSFGADAVTVASYPSDSHSAFYWQKGPAAENLAAVMCEYRRAGSGPCTASDIASRFPELKQADHTVYYVWPGCSAWNTLYGYGFGHNFEYFAPSRTLVVHCYMATGWLYVKPAPGYVQAGYAPVLLAIPTTSIRSGILHIDEDDRLEHWTGDLSTEYELTTATIS